MDEQGLKRSGSLLVVHNFFVGREMISRARLLLWFADAWG